MLAQIQEQIERAEKAYNSDPRNLGVDYQQFLVGWLEGFGLDTTAAEQAAGLVPMDDVLDDMAEYYLSGQQWAG